MPTANKGAKLAQLYTYQTLDVLVELIESISREYHENRHERYRFLDQDVRSRLADFRKVGIDLKFPDKQSRDRSFFSFLGNQFSSRSHPVLEQAKSLQRCASRYVEYTESDPDSPNHCLGCVEVAAHGLLHVLTQLTMGAAVEFTRAHARTGAIFHMATTILRNESFAAAFGVNEIGDEDWPETEYNRRGGTLLRQMLAVGDPVSASDGGLTDLAKLHLEHFKELQECALFGARTIRMIFEKKGNLESESYRAELAVMAARWHESTLRLPKKVDRRRFTTRYVAQLTKPLSREPRQQQAVSKS